MRALLRQLRLPRRRGRAVDALAALGTGRHLLAQARLCLPLRMHAMPQLARAAAEEEGAVVELAGGAMDALQPARFCRSAIATATNRTTHGPAVWVCRP